MFFPEINDRPVKVSKTLLMAEIKKKKRVKAHNIWIQSSEVMGAKVKINLVLYKDREWKQTGIKTKFNYFPVFFFFSSTLI